MIRQRRTWFLLPAWIGLASFFIPSGAAIRSAPGVDMANEVDKLFAPWDRRDTPGAAVIVIDGGRVVHKKGYGMANLEWNVPNTSRTVFCIGSVSKQFTAYAIALLAARGRIRLDDDYRTYIPEMPDYGTRITVGDLVYHMSGLRDDQMIFYLGDWERGELHGAQAVIDNILAKQRGLLFRPGEAFDYSNANYCLLGEIVRRTGGMSLREFARANIFGPLGMADTFFLDDFREVVRNRAWSYIRTPQGGYQAYVDTYDQVGAGGVHTTVEDMALWNANFDSSRAGGLEVVRQALTPGRLRNGDVINYAFGLELDTFKGLKVVKHDGSYGGYRAMFLRFPEERFAVFCAANAGDMDTRVQCYRIARLFLKDKLKDSPAAAPAFVCLERKALKGLTGDFRSSKNMDLMTVSVSGDRLLCKINEDLSLEYAPVSSEEFRPLTPGWPVVLKFGPSGNGTRPEIRAYQEGKLLYAYEPIERTVPTEKELREYEGAYFSEEIDATYRFEVKDGNLYVRFKRAPKSALKPLVEDQFAAWPLIFDFERNAKGKVKGFRLGKIGPGGIPFTRLEAPRPLPR